MESHISTASIHRRSLSIRALQGAVIAAVLLLTFSILSGNFSTLLTLTVPPGGAIGGASFYLTDAIRCRNAFCRVIANISSITFYLAVLVAAFSVA